MRAMPRTASVRAAWPVLNDRSTMFIWIEPREKEPLGIITADLIRLGFLALADEHRNAVSAFPGHSLCGARCHSRSKR